MSGMLARYVRPLLILTTATSAAAQTAPPATVRGETLSVGALRTVLSAEDKVGHKRAGLICAPAGTLRWRDVEPSGAKAAAAIARAVRDAGVAMDAPEADDWLGYRAPSTGYRLIGAVVGMDASACVPAYGLARKVDHGQRLKGDGRMRVEWRIYRLADRKEVARTQTCAAFRFDEPKLLPSDIGQLGAIENARVLGRELAAHAPALTLPTTLIAPGQACPERVEGHRTPNGEVE